MSNRLLVGFARGMIVFILISLVFSGTSFDIQSTLKSLFSDVFGYSSPESQNEVMSRLLGTCESIKGGNKLFTVNEICNNATLLKQMKEPKKLLTTKDRKEMWKEE